MFHQRPLLKSRSFDSYLKNIEMQLDSGAEIVYVFDTNNKQLEGSILRERYLGMVKKALFQPFLKK